jgi:uncharacterized repeat protein (TIGR03833 family)
MTKDKQAPSIGDTVEIAIKPYKGKTEKGIIKKILTKKKYHSRGHKVMLYSGTIGRIIKTIKNKIKKTLKKKICKSCGKKY